MYIQKKEEYKGLSRRYTYHSNDVTSEITTLVIKNFLLRSSDSCVPYMVNPIKLSSKNHLLDNNFHDKFTLPAKHSRRYYFHYRKSKIAL